MIKIHRFRVNHHKFDDPDKLIYQLRLAIKRLNLSEPIKIYFHRTDIDFVSNKYTIDLCFNQ